MVSGEEWARARVIGYDDKDVNLCVCVCVVGLGTHAQDS